MKPKSYHDANFVIIDSSDDKVGIMTTLGFQWKQEMYDKNLTVWPHSYITVTCWQYIWFNSLLIHTQVVIEPFK